MWLLWKPVWSEGKLVNFLSSCSRKETVKIEVLRSMGNRGRLSCRSSLGQAGWTPTGHWGELVWLKRLSSRVWQNGPCTFSYTNSQPYCSPPIRFLLSPLSWSRASPSHQPTHPWASLSSPPSHPARFWGNHHTSVFSILLPLTWFSTCSFLILFPSSGFLFCFQNVFLSHHSDHIALYTCVSPHPAPAAGPPAGGMRLQDLVCTQTQGEALRLKIYLVSGGQEKTRRKTQALRSGNEQSLFRETYGVY